jgi:predicted phage-related endonuclease
MEQAILEVYVWILSGLLSFLLLILIFAGRAIAKGVGEKLDMLVQATIKQTEQIKILFKNIDTAQKRIDRLKKEQSKLKTNQYSCKNFDPK